MEVMEVDNNSQMRSNDSADEIPDLLKTLDSTDEAQSQNDAEEEIFTIQIDEDIEVYTGEETDLDTDDPLSENLSVAEAEGQNIDRLLQGSMSVSEVAKFLGEDTDSDAEDDSGEEVEDHAAAFEKELDEQQRYQLRRKGKGGHGKRRCRKLPAALQGLMGEANLQYARCEHNEAIKMCMEVIRQYPHASDPYSTLSMIYEQLGMTVKSLQFLLITAFLSPNAEAWENLAKHHQVEDPHQAVFCWGRAIRADPQNLDYHWARCKLLENLGEKTKALRGYMHMLKYLRPEQGKDGLKLAIEISKIHYASEDLHLAQETLQTAFKKYPSFVSAEDTNLMLEVLMQRQNFGLCVQILINHMSVQIQAPELPVKIFTNQSIEEQVKSATQFTAPDELPIDLKAKLAISFIHLKNFDLAQPLVDALKRESEDDFGDLYLEMAEAFAKNEVPDRALPLLQPLLSSQEYSVAAVWLLYASCLADCSEFEESAEAYAQVVKLAPQHAEARLSYSHILQTLGRDDDALGILKPSSENSPLDSMLLHQRCKILLENNQVEDFIITAKLLLRRHFVHIRSRQEAENLLRNKKVSSKLELLLESRRSQNQPLEDTDISYTGLDVPVDDQWEIFVSLCHLLCDLKRFVELERLALSALGCRSFMKDPAKAKEVEFICLLSCIYNESFHFAYNIMRDFIHRDKENQRYWNLMSLIISKADDIRHNRFLLGLTSKNSDSVPIGLLNGHNCLVAGSYKFALVEYTQAFKQDPSNPLIPLMLGLTYTHMACQKFSGKKHLLAIQACAFLNTYMEMRGECQESNYNLGRAMHQLNLLPQAIFYYKKALALPAPDVPPGGPSLDLTRETAFNLSLIYKNSGNLDLARMYLYKYITV